uniref:Uncharacterized protein n=1 Tax=Rhizophora mucronata TaxID=61149 RepID=A0A2P2Q9G7_RHIMU
MSLGLSTKTNRNSKLYPLPHTKITVALATRAPSFSDLNTHRLTHQY